jgi:hypothetical protein
MHIENKCRLWKMLYPFNHPSIHPSIHSSIHPCLHPSIRPSVRPSIRPSVRPSIHPSMALQPFGRVFSFFIFYTVGRIPWTGDQPVERPLSALRAAQMENKRTQTSMPQAGLEPTTPVFEREKTVHASDCAATVIG